MQFLPQSYRLLYSIMRLIIYQLLLALAFAGLATARNAHAQELLQRRVTLQVAGQPMKAVLTRLSKLTRVRFTYSSALIRAERKVSLHVTDQPLNEVLDELLKPMEIEYRTEANEVILYRPSAGQATDKNSPAGVLNEPAGIPLTGTVTDERGEGLPGVSIVVKGTSIGTTTDPQGNYTINLPAGNGILVFSFIGYVTQEVPADNRSVISVTLVPDITSLNEVVVVGYGTVKKSDLTGSVSSISSKEVDALPIATTEQILQGRAAGVVVTQNSAEPGAGASIRIRGTNSIGASNEPLFVIDGFAGADNLNAINPNDIESIEVLKDASATAIYGARGANGVVIVTTKRGKAGATRIDFDMYMGAQEIRRKIGLMNAYDYATYRNEVIYLDSIYRKPTVPQQYFASPERLEELKTQSTDWQDAIYRRAMLSNYQLSVSGGDEKTRYLISGNYYNENGIVRNSGFKRGSLRINFDKTVTKELKFGLTLFATRTFNNRTLVNTAGGTTGGVVTNVFRTNPATPVYNADGTFNSVNILGENGVGDLVGNPVAYAEKSKDDNHNTRLNGNWFGEYQIIPDLTLRVNFGGDLANGSRFQFIPTDIFEGLRDNGTATRTHDNRYNLLNENYLTYYKSLSDKTDLTLLAGASWQLAKREGTTAVGRNFFTNAFEDNNLSAATVQETYSSASQNQIQSFFVRGNVKLGDRYLFTFTGRRDGSSRFGANYRYGYFPSGAVAWKLSEEPFMQSLRWLDELKLRTSYGITGNQEIPSYFSTEAYATRGITYGTTRQIGATPARYAQADLRWERTASFDVGFDLSVLGNRINLVADYYFKKTTDQLLNVETQRATGYASALVNAGSIQNEGVEVALSTTNLDAAAFRWTTNFNLAFTRNKVLDLNGEQIRFVGAAAAQSGLFTGGTGALIPGQSIGSFYGITFDGLWQTQEEIEASALTPNEKARYRPGDPRYIDTNGDGIINLNDRTIIGQAIPKFNAGMTNTLTYKGLTLSVFLNGVYGNHILNHNKWELEISDYGNRSTRLLDRWTGPGTSNTVPRAGSSSVRRQVSTELLEDGSYLRVKNVTLGYDFNASSGLLKAVRLRSLRLYATGTNLLTFTRYSGYDPEVSSFASSTSGGLNILALGIDAGAYPTVKSLIFGIKIGI